MTGNAQQLQGRPSSENMRRASGYVLMSLPGAVDPQLRNFALLA